MKMSDLAPALYRFATHLVASDGQVSIIIIIISYCMQIYFDLSIPIIEFG
jgi:hypothetical protein